MANFNPLKMLHLFCNLKNKSNPRNWTFPKDATLLSYNLIPHFSFNKRECKSNENMLIIKQMMNHFLLIFLNILEESNFFINFIRKLSIPIFFDN